MYYVVHSDSMSITKVTRRYQVTLPKNVRVYIDTNIYVYAILHHLSMENYVLRS